MNTATKPMSVARRASAMTMRRSVPVPSGGGPASSSGTAVAVVCPSASQSAASDVTSLAMTPDSPEAAALIKLLVDRHVAVTSTLPVFEQRLLAVRGILPRTKRDLYAHDDDEIALRAAEDKAQLPTNS